jgi:4-hydroxy-tetrahydrodipicolinate reductase
MNPVTIMINGLPGNMAANVAKFALRDDRFNVVLKSLTGPEITEPHFSIGQKTFQLILPKDRDPAMAEIKDAEPSMICVDFTHPSAVNDNAAFYCRHSLPFVMGTTGGDREALAAEVRESSIPAVIAPNMAKQIVGFQAMMAHAADNFRDLFKGYALTVRESHQAGKADTSGTARAMIGHFNQLGIPFTESDIVMERDPETQKNQLGVPDEYLKGHAWHTYTLRSADQTVTFQFTHNVNGRDIYAMGTLDAVIYLSEKIRKGAQATVFTMIDVLRGA